MKYEEVKPKHNEYWWVLDEDGTRTIVWIEHGKNDSVIAQYPGNEETYNAYDLDYVGKAVTLNPVAQEPKPFDFSDLNKEEDVQTVSMKNDGKTVFSVSHRKLSDDELTDLDMNLGNSAKVVYRKSEGASILDKVTHNELDREKIELADALISLLPGDYSKMQRIKMLEDAIGYTPKHVLHGDTLNDVDNQTEQQKE